MGGNAHENTGEVNWMIWAGKVSVFTTLFSGTFAGKAGSSDILMGFDIYLSPFLLLLFFCFHFLQLLLHIRYFLLLGLFLTS